MNKRVHDARHDVASAAAALVMANAHIARALAYPAEPDYVAATKATLDAALNPPGRPVMTYTRRSSA